jgi:hypothetical protein
MRQIALFMVVACTAACSSTLDPRRLETKISVPQSEQGHGWFHTYYVTAEAGAARAGLRRGQVKNIVEDMLLRGLRNQNYSVQPDSDRSSVSFNTSVTSLSYDRTTGVAEAQLRVRMPRRSFDQTYRSSVGAAASPRTEATQYSQVGMVLRSLIEKVVTDPSFLATLDRSDENGPVREQLPQQQELQQSPSGPVVTQQQQQQQQQPLRPCAPGERPQWVSYTQHVPGPERFRLTCAGPDAPPHPGLR